MRSWKVSLAAWVVVTHSKGAENPGRNLISGLGICMIATMTTMTAMTTITPGRKLDYYHHCYIVLSTKKAAPLEVLSSGQRHGRGD